MNIAARITVDRKAAAQGVVARLAGIIDKKKMLTDALMTYAYSGDASSYRLIPAAVVFINTEDEVRAVIKAARAEGLPLTFRAAGTSLSGQAITDGVLAVLGDGWLKLRVEDNGDRVTLGPAVIVANANRALKPFNRKLGPDPASQATCKIGGVVNNNSSGMCCGVAYNTYHTMQRLRLMLVDGTVLDSGDPASVAAFRISHAGMLAALQRLHHEVMDDAELLALIRRKYKIKNTVGYSLNALVDFHDPLDILIHLMVGSEGTLGFVSEVTYSTIPEHPHIATGLIPFPDPFSAAKAIVRMANGGVQSTTGVTAAEYIERRALQTVLDRPAMQGIVPYLTENSPAILIDVSAPDLETLHRELAATEKLLLEEGATHLNFSTEDSVHNALWDVRKGFFASGGAARPKGTSMLTEDVAAPIDRLAEFVIDMRKLLDDHGYFDAIIFGHALAGNLHFQMSDDFMAPGAAEKFDRLSQDLSELVSVRYGGSLKAEHGTGRAIAPFVEREWGQKAYRLMHDIKEIFDPEMLLNPGVLLNADQHIHIKNLKLMPLADPVIDLCIECGFCEPACPSHQMTLSPRQRIVVTREMARLEQTGEDPARLKELHDGFKYAGMDTCAACNLCSLRCPVGIETGTMIMGDRAERRDDRSRGVAHFTASHANTVETFMRLGVGSQTLARKVIGNAATDVLARTARALTGGAVPRVSEALKPGPGIPRRAPAAADAPLGNVVYFPSCATRMFGAPTKIDLGEGRVFDLLPATTAMIALLNRVGFNPIVPDHLNGACCGQPFLSKGFPEESDRLGAATDTTLSALSEGGKYPVVTDASTCAKHFKDHAETPVADSADFLVTEILPRLVITAPIPVVAVHHNCSAQRLKEQPAIEAVARAAAGRIAVMTSVTCCGYAGDKGLFIPELNAHATRFAKNDIPADCRIGVSTVSTCASGLTERAGIPFVSLASLLEAVSRPVA
ncbi:MAG: putative D-lactate dehydrogenase, Fe-S protein FAD/FMN-containing [Devosia sp.]|nr:putative D-lactate dehydrogenase, Fe-S protein FAD/FMN-containing [Devosia sp.]